MNYEACLASCPAIFQSFVSRRGVGFCGGCTVLAFFAPMVVSRAFHFRLCTCCFALFLRAIWPLMF